MPIIGLTDRQSITPSFPTIGKLHKGGPKQEKVNKDTGRVELDQYDRPIMIQGKDLECFRFDSSRPEVQVAFTTLYGQEPRLLSVYLPYATPDECFETWKEAWSTGRVLNHRCDGRKVVLEYKNGKYQHYADTPYDQRPDCPGRCKEGGRLTLILPELWTDGFLGYITLETHSKHDLMNLMASLQEAYEKRQEHGLDLRGMKFTLRRVNTVVSAPTGNGKRGEVTKSLLQIEPSVDWARLQIETSRQAERKMLQVVNSESDLPPIEPIDPDYEGEEEVEEPSAAVQRQRNIATGDALRDRLRQLTTDPTIINGLNKWDARKTTMNDQDMQLYLARFQAKIDEFSHPLSPATSEPEPEPNAETEMTLNAMCDYIVQHGNDMQAASAETFRETQDREGMMTVYHEVHQA